MRRVLSAILVIPASGLLAQEAATDLGLREFNGPEQSLLEYRGKVVALNFWATWCEPCGNEMPLFVAAHRKYSGSGVVIVGASADMRARRGRSPHFCESRKLNSPEFPIWLGATTEHMQRLGLGEGLPATAFIDRRGEIASRILGPVTKAELEQRIEYLLGSAQGAPAPTPLVDKIDDAIHGHDHKGRRNTRMGRWTRRGVHRSLVTTLTRRGQRREQGRREYSQPVDSQRTGDSGADPAGESQDYADVKNLGLSYSISF